ncbi:MAG: sugar transferase [Lachnospiraceae bacterium]|nr:sugar transferase [Lachnospiraceae bacterium]
MKKHLHKFETTMWLFIKLVFYTSLMMTFVHVLGRESIGLTRLSRTLGITVTTFAIVGLLFLSTYGKYDVGRRKSKPIICSLTLAVICTDIVTYLQLMIMRTNVPNIRTFRLISLGLLCIAFLIQLVLIFFFTYAGNWLFFLIHKPEKCCVITSSQRRLDELIFSMQRFKKQYEVASVVDYHNPNIREHIKKAQTVFVYDVPVESRTDIMRWCYQYKVNIYFNPEIEDIMELNAEQYVLNDVYLLNKNVKALTMEQRIVKRMMDIVMSIVLGVLSSPFWIIGSLAVKLHDGGPVLFKQERATIHGKRFEVYKLRTMKPNNDNHSVTKDDDRITKPGKFLRRTRIDELPQLLNVLKGDMTFVGPRPEMIKNVKEYTEELPEFEYRLRVKAGLTGYAQIRGKYNTTPKDKLIMDMMYIEQFSILKDIQLIFQTAIVLLKSDSTEAFDRKNGHCPYTFEKWNEKKND